MTLHVIRGEGDNTSPSNAWPDGIPLAWGGTEENPTPGEWGSRSAEVFSDKLRRMGEEARRRKRRAEENDSN